MFRLALYQYKEGIQKISFTRFLKEEKKISLSEAKNALDKFLEGIPLLFLFTSKTEMLKFKKTAETLGAICKIITTPLFVRTSQLHKGTLSTRSAKKINKSDSEFAEVLMMS